MKIDSIIPLRRTIPNGSVEGGCYNELKHLITAIGFNNLKNWILFIFEKKLS